MRQFLLAAALLLALISSSFSSMPSAAASPLANVGDADIIEVPVSLGQASLQNGKLFLDKPLVIVAQAQSSDECIPGYVWREAFPGDHVCVTPQTRAQADYDNRHASERVDENAPGGAVYGGNVCLPGYVWREARPSDLVCVTPETRAQTKYDNSQAKNRLANNDSWTYKNPKWWRDNYRLDWCLNWGTQCGQPAADNYCHRHRWTGALDFAADPNIGTSEPTITSGSYKVCDQSSCTGFAYITCYGGISYKRVYANPAWQGHRLDVCLHGDSECGKPAADAYCRQYGFTESFYHLVDPVPSDVDTITIGTGKVYDANKYTLYDFDMIICQ
jgi:hypothetical protein